MASVTLLRHARKASLNNRDVISWQLTVKALAKHCEREESGEKTYIFSILINFS